MVSEVGNPSCLKSYLLQQFHMQYIKSGISVGPVAQPILVLPCSLSNQELRQVTCIHMHTTLITQLLLFQMLHTGRTIMLFYHQGPTSFRRNLSKNYKPYAICFSKNDVYSRSVVII